MVWNATDTKVILSWEQVRALEDESEVTGYKVSGGVGQQLGTCQGSAGPGLVSTLGGAASVCRPHTRVSVRPFVKRTLSNGSDFPKHNRSGTILLTWGLWIRSL